MEHTNAVHLAQAYGLLAADLLGLNPCNRIEGNGRTLVLHECRTETVTVKAIETKCGFQPFFINNNKNWTIGKDSWSMHPFHECFWITPLHKHQR